MKFGLQERDYGPGFGSWKAEIGKNRGSTVWRLGSTPEEAAALLWLALNKKI
jgi:hypothetical protein